MGKYARDTKDLSMMEHGAYCLLLDYYYSNGRIEGFSNAHSNAQALLPDNSRPYRVCTAISREEQQCVDNVLRKFFRYDSGFYVNDKCDQVIEEQMKKHEKRVRAGRLGGRSNATSNAGSNAPQKKTETKNKKDDDERGSEIFKFGEIVAEVVGWKDDPRWFGNYSRIGAWLAGGCDFEIDILPTIKKVMANKRGDKPKSLAYFESAIADAYATRTTPMEKGIPNATSRQNTGKSGKSERAKSAILEGLNIGPGTSE
jgi:uncharacterized protein YdaU (DUF1376 family)